MRRVDRVFTTPRMGTFAWLVYRNERLDRDVKLASRVELDTPMPVFSKTFTGSAPKSGSSVACASARW